MVKFKKITIFLSGAGEDLIAGYQVDLGRANLFREQEFCFGHIRGIGAHISCAFLHKKRNRIFSDEVYLYDNSMFILKLLIICIFMFS